MAEIPDRDRPWRTAVDVEDPRPTPRGSGGGETTEAGVRTGYGLLFCGGFSYGVVDYVIAARQNLEAPLTIHLYAPYVDGAWLRGRRVMLLLDTHDKLYGSCAAVDASRWLLFLGGPVL